MPWRQSSDAPPVLPFPCAFLQAMPGFYGNGSTINGRKTEVFLGSPESDADRY